MRCNREAACVTKQIARGCKLCDILTVPAACSNCDAGNIVCETRESRRGKHPRPSKKRRSESDASSTVASYGQNIDEVAASHVLASMYKDGDKPNDAVTKSIAGPESVIQADQLISPEQDPKEDDGDVYVGESSSLGYVTQVPQSTTQPGPVQSAGYRLRYPVPNFVKAEALVPQWEIDRRTARHNFLRTDGAFSFPPSPIVEKLLKAYFRWFHPCFAIVDEVDIWDQYRRGVMSPLLLQAILFIGVLHCEEAVLTELGFDSRHRAKYLFYNRVKDIYDAEFERRKLTVIQALFLMSFWRAGALLEKDTRHWLGCAITLAQTKALHRSAGKAETQEAKLRKRLWWSLYTRDRQCAAALGLPYRIRDEDCDFEHLELSDFQYAFNPTITKSETEEYASYAVTMTELARLLGSILHSAYLPNKPFSNFNRVQMREELGKWKSRLPPRQPELASNAQTSFITNMQHLAYNNLLILLYRHEYILNHDDGRETDGNMVLQTAADSSRIIEDMLSEGNLRHGQIHVITNLFNTLCIHTVHLRRSEGTTKTVAEHRAKFCLLGLQELQKTWEVTNWVLQLFFQYLDRATASRLRVQGDEHLVSTGALPSTHQTPIVQPLGFDLIQGNRTANAMPEADALPGITDGVQPAGTPWTWSSDEANNFLFSQIEDDFAFGEGEMLNWSPDATAAGLNNTLFPPPDMDPNFMPQFP